MTSGWEKRTRDGRFCRYTKQDLVEYMQKNARLAASFARHRGEGYTGDTWSCEAQEAANELRIRGFVVDEDWNVESATD